MIITGEREYPSEPGTIVGIDGTHVQRYAWAKEFVADKRVVDVACGCGYGCLVLGASWYLGLDIDAEAIDYATAHYLQDGRHIRFETRNAEAIGDLDEPYDVVVSFETIEHLAQPEAFLEWLADNVPMAIISTPIRADCGQSPFHIREYTVSEFRSLLSAHFVQVEFYLQADGRIELGCADDAQGNILAVVSEPRKHAATNL